MFEINIQPLQILLNPDSPRAEVILVRLTNYVPNEYAEFHCELRSNDGYILHSKTLVMEGEEFENWGSDDNYLLEWICANLGAVRV